jgi:hypothetical protein
MLLGGPASERVVSPKQKEKTMLLTNFKVVVAPLLAVGVYAIGAGVLSPALHVTAQGPAEARKHFPTPAELGKLATVIEQRTEEQVAADPLDHGCQRGLRRPRRRNGRSCSSRLWAISG